MVPSALGPTGIPKPPGIMGTPIPESLVIRGWGVPKTRGPHITATPVVVI